jgi:hypothetical protein
MRRSRLATLLGGVLMAGFLVPSAALAAAAPATGAPPAPVAAAQPAAATTAIKLGCSAVIPVPRTAHREIDCHWSALSSTGVSAYQLWRWVDGRPRRLIATVTPDQPLSHADTRVSAGHRYGYRVVAVGSNGSRLGVSNLVAIRLGRAAQRLAFKCVFVVDGQQQGVACHWSRTTRAAAVRYVLYRSVDGAARQAIYRSRINGRRSFFDTKVSAGQTIRYAVVARTLAGRIVAVGGPRAIAIPVVTAPSAAL